jgi:hypothetical protein
LCRLERAEGLLKVAVEPFLQSNFGFVDGGHC